MPFSTKLLLPWTVFVFGLFFTPGTMAQEAKADELIKKAIEYKDQKQYDLAIQYCNKALDFYPQSSWAYNVRGRSYSEKTDYDQAIRDYSKALQIDSGYASAYRNRGYAYWQKESYDQAIKDYTRSLQLASKDTNSYINRGNIYYDKGDYQLAVKDYVKVLELEPLNKYALLNILPCLIRLNRFSEAASWYSKYTTNNVQGYLEKEVWKYYKSYLNAATVYVGGGYYNAALQELKTAEKTYDSYYLANKSSSSTDAKKGLSDVLALKGYVLEKLRMNDEAKSAYKLALATRSNQPDVQLRLDTLNGKQTTTPGTVASSQKSKADEINKQALEYNNNKQYDQAIQLCNQALGHDPQNAWSYNIRGTCYYNKADYDLAIKDYTQALQIDSTYTQVYTNRGNAYLEKSEYDLAIKDANKALLLNPKNVNAYITRGNAYHNKESNNEAISDYTRAIELDSTMALLYYNRGNTYRRIEDYDKSIKNYSKALELDPKYTNAYNNRGIAYKNLGYYDLAVRDNTTALEQNPVHTHAMLNILPCLIRLNRFAEAASWYNKYKTSGTTGYIENKAWEYYKSYLTAATLYVKNNRYNEALNEIKTAETKYSSYNAIDKMASAPDAKRGYTDVLALKGYILEALNQPAKAKDAYSQTLVINTNQPDITARLNVLKSSEILATNTDHTPPLIDLYSPAPSSILTVLLENNTAQIVGQARDVSGIASVLINGKSVKSIDDNGLFVSTASLKQGINKITIAATDRAGNQTSKEFTITCNGTASSVLTDLPLLDAPDAPRYYAILIAEKDYTDKSFLSLNNPVLDALKLKRVLETKYTFPSSNIDTLFNRNRDDILGLIAQRCNTLKENDNLLIFYAGHGTARKDQHNRTFGYLVPSSAKKGNYASYISSVNIAEVLTEDSHVKHILFIADACFSGSLTRSEEDDMPRNIKSSYENKSRKIMASGNLEPVPDNSMFMYHVLDRLEKNKEKYLTDYDLFNSVFLEVKKTTYKQDPQYAIIANTGDEGGKFVFIRK